MVMCKKNFIIYVLFTCVLSGTIMPISAQDDHVSPTVPDDESDIMVVGRNNGSFEQDVFFADKDASYEIQIPLSDEEKDADVSIIVKIGESEQEIPVAGEKVCFPIETGQEGYLEIFCDDAGHEGKVLPDYIVAEETPPVVSYAELESENGEDMVVSIRDDGEIVSGIRNYEVLLDGETLEGCKEVKTEKKLPNGTSIYDKVEITIPAGAETGHELSVAAEDQCGNLAEKSISLDEREDKAPQGKENKEQNSIDSQQENIDDVFVVVPTDVELKLFTGPNLVKDNVQSQDIMVINKSKFPVQVKVSQIQYEIKRKDKKVPSDLSVIVRQYEKKEQIRDLGKKDSIPFYMELAAAREETDAQELLKKAAEWNPTGSVISPDYGVLRLKGTATQSGKASVSMVFEFEKIE